MYRKILVPLDGSKVAEGVLPHARALAYSEGAELILLTVGANPVMDYAFSDPGIAQRAIDEQEQRSKKYISEKGPNAFYESVENRKECCHIRKVEPLKRAFSCMLGLKTQT